MTLNPGHTLIIIILSQFFCTSLWFAGNAIAPELTAQFDLGKGALAHLTSSVQFGFITGTFVFALFSLSDRFSACSVFFTCAFLAAFSNLCIALFPQGMVSITLFRAATGFFLAGIYPVGMKIASDHYKDGLGLALGFLVGALVLGTSFPHLLKMFPQLITWKALLFITSLLSVTGGILIKLTIPANNPRAGMEFSLANAFRVFRVREFRSASFGYFGHMWELYTFWAFIPIIIKTYNSVSGMDLNISFWSFIVIALGSFGCVSSGFISRKIGSRKTAFTALLLSGICCVVSPFSFYFPPIVFIAFIILWGLVVIADSPMFSTLVAQSGSAGLKGTGLTIVTCIGFAITIVSLEVINILKNIVDNTNLYLVLAIGPCFGLVSMWMGRKKSISLNN